MVPNRPKYTCSWSGQEVCVGTGGTYQQYPPPRPQRPQKRPGRDEAALSPRCACTATEFRFLVTVSRPTCGPSWPAARLWKKKPCAWARKKTVWRWQVSRAEPSVGRGNDMQRVGGTCRQTCRGGGCIERASQGKTKKSTLLRTFLWLEKFVFVCDDSHNFFGVQTKIINKHKVHQIEKNMEITKNSMASFDFFFPLRHSSLVFGRGKS